MYRGRSDGPLEPGRSFGALSAHILAVIVALMLAAGGASPGRAQADGAEPGFVMVICADGVAKTVVADSAANPVEPSDEAACAGSCLCCTLPESHALSPDVGAPLGWDAVATAGVFPMTRAALPSESRGRPDARGPPTEEDA